ncbi:radical SAM protein [Psychrobacter sp. Pi2-52]|uniref:radical SAM protein n=1 Tax=Psychrobacter sp. Pi2-52 TaxID=2774133 RepID=UPI001918B0BB|nr:radical SAM protein [Psychrobacter sp. Pi2-52]
MNIPETIDWFVTSKCNLKCDFCYGPYPESESRDILKSIAQQISTSSIANVTLCGGEPFVNPDIFEIIDILLKDGKNVYVSTNGHFPEKLSRVLDKLSGISISLDAGNNIDFERIRGRLSNFDKVVDSIKLVSTTHSHKLKVTTVLSRVNIESIINIGEFISEFNPKVWRILQFVPRMKGSINRDIYEISNEEFIKSVQALGPIFPNLNIYASKSEDIDSCFLIDHAGNILLPQGEDYSSVGNCFEQSIEECWNNFWESKETHYRNKIWMSEIR